MKNEPHDVGITNDITKFEENPEIIRKIGLIGN